MGLTDSRPTLVAAAPKGIIDPATGKPIGANDPYFLGVNDQLADKGFLVTSTDELIVDTQEIGIVRADRLAGRRIDDALGRRRDKCRTLGRAAVAQSHSSAPFFHS